MLLMLSSWMCHVIATKPRCVVNTLRHIDGIMNAVVPDETFPDSLMLGMNLNYIYYYFIGLNVWLVVLKCLEKRWKNSPQVSAWFDKRFPGLFLSDLQARARYLHNFRLAFYIVGAPILIPLWAFFDVIDDVVNRRQAGNAPRALPGHQLSDRLERLVSELGFWRKLKYAPRTKTAQQAVIPFELCEMVIDFCQADRETLKACSLVSPTWTPRTRVHLFHSVNAYRSRAYELFKFLRTPSCSFAQCIRYLELRDEKYWHTVESVLSELVAQNQTLEGLDLTFTIRLVFTQPTSLLSIFPCSD
jgi:hypothetical protein